MNLSSKNKTILVLSDIHQEIDKAEYIIKNEAFDYFVNLGDEFDSFTHNTAFDVEKTCNFIKKYIFRDNYYFCHANHTIGYLFNNRHLLCSGYNEHKDAQILETLGAHFLPIREKFLWYLWIDNHLCSHAGINPYHFGPGLKPDRKSITKWLDGQIKEAEAVISTGQKHWLYAAGMGRGGSQMIGGITWQDFNTEFEPIDGIPQIVGHTAHDQIKMHPSDGGLELESSNLDIDAHLNEYLVINNGKFIIKNFADL